MWVITTVSQKETLPRVSYAETTNQLTQIVSQVIWDKVLSVKIENAAKR